MAQLTGQSPWLLMYRAQLLTLTWRLMEGFLEEVTAWLGAKGYAGVCRLSLLLPLHVAFAEPGLSWSLVYLNLPLPDS